MPVTLYQDADSAARANKLRQLLFIWEVIDPKPVVNHFDCQCYETKIAALVPYLENEHVHAAVLRMREEIAKYIRAEYGL